MVGTDARARKKKSSPFSPRFLEWGYTVRQILPLEGTAPSAPSIEVSSSSRNSRCYLLQEIQIKCMIRSGVFIGREINSFDSIIGHCVDEACNRSTRLRSVGHQDCALTPISTGNRLDCTVVVVCGGHVLKLDHRIAAAKELGGGKCPGIENHRSHIGGDLCIGVTSCILHICEDRARTVVVHVIEEDAID